MLKYQNLANKLLDIVSTNGEEANARCIFHNDSSPSLRFNMSSGLYFCHGCGASGNAEQLARGQASLFSDPDTAMEILDSQMAWLKEAPTENRTPLYLPESSLARFNFPHPYWEHRGFDEDTIQEFDLGYDPISQRVTIPVRNEHAQIIGVIQRQLDDRRPKYLYPKGFSRSRNLFASWRITRHMYACLVEGSLDAIRIWQAGYPALGIYGSTISDEQIRLLHRLGIQRVLLFFDNDTAGRGATVCARQKIRGIAIEEVKWPRKWDGRDPGGLTLSNIDRMCYEYFK